MGINFIKLFVREIRQKLNNLRKRNELLSRGLVCSSTAIVNYPDISRISFGKSCTVGHYSILDVADDPTSGDPDAILTLGSFVYIGEQCNIRACGSEIKIGNHTMIASNVVIVSSNHKTDLGRPMHLQPWEKHRSGVIIGEDCWIGSNSIILPGAIIGDGAVIAGGSVVRGEIPPFTIWGGVPAKQLKNRQA